MAQGNVPKDVNKKIPQPLSSPVEPKKSPPPLRVVCEDAMPRSIGKQPKP